MRERNVPENRIWVRQVRNSKDARAFKSLKEIPEGKHHGPTRPSPQAEALFARKEKLRSEGVVAMADYLRKQEEQLANLARLRALRLGGSNQRAGVGPSGNAFKGLTADA